MPPVDDGDRITISVIERQYDFRNLCVGFGFPQVFKIGQVDICSFFVLYRGQYESGGVLAGGRLVSGNVLCYSGWTVEELQAEDASRSYFARSRQLRRMGSFLRHRARRRTDPP